MAVHLIKNFRDLAVTETRRDALEILEAGLKAINTHAAVKHAVKLRDSRLTINGQSWNLKEYKRIYVIGIGKAAAEAGCALEDLLGSRITGGILLDVKTVKTKILKSIAGTHPLPTEKNVRATAEILDLLRNLASDDLVIVIVSGGGSALLCQPYQIRCDQLARITEVLMKNGATIQEINTVRKHLSEVQGGQLARLAYPATMIGLVFSDVPGNDLDVIASGPTILDMTTVDDARAVIDRYELFTTCRIPDCDLRETPKDPIFFQHVTNILLICNGVALDAMERKARALKYKVRVYSKAQDGEARKAGELLAGLPKKGEVVLAAGETTVIVKGKGRGGRNQELALGALRAIKSDVLVLSCASDGIDNTPVAGAIADQMTKEGAERLHLNPKTFLDRNDAFAFFQKCGSFILTGVTGANVSDLMISIRK